MLQDILACFVLEIETSNPAKRKHHFTDNAGNQQNSEKDTNWKIQVQVIKNREQVAISNILKPGAAGVNALAFKPVVLNYAAVKVSLHFCQDQLKSAQGFKGRKATGPRHGERAGGAACPTGTAHGSAGGKGSPFRRNLFTQHKKHAGDRPGLKHI